MTTSSGDSMSEHPELREAERQRLQIEMANTVYEQGPGWERTVSHAVASALLAGPVGKLQAELAEAQQALRSVLRFLVTDSALSDLRQLDPSFRARQGHITRKVTAALAAGESAVTGEATCATCGGSGWQVLDDGPGDREVWRCPACEDRPSAVTGEAT